MSSATDAETKGPLAWLLTRWQWVMLVFVPIAVFCEVQGMHTAVFITACIAVVPLAGIMGHATEDLSDNFGPGVGSLLNATFGNAAELILAFVALRASHFEIVRASIPGRSSATSSSSLASPR